MIVSGETIAFLEPQEQVWTGQSGRSFKIKELSKYSDHLKPLEGIEGFTKCTEHYSKTLFRFPLRTTASDLSESVYTVEKVHELIDALKSEGKLLLLFLRSIHAIEVYNIDQQGMPTLSFQVKVEDSFIKDLKKQKADFLEELSFLHASNNYGFSTMIKFTAKFNVSVYDTNTQSHSTSHWLVSNRVDPSNDTVREASIKQKVFPWVGTAVQLDNPGNGRIFCFLPMPIETASNLPVHINGTFGLNDDRRSIKWPGVERRNDLTAAWNELLLEQVIPACYTDLLLQAKDELDSSNFYKAWPGVNPLSPPWVSLLTPVFNAILSEPVTWCEALKEWAVPEQAVYIPRSGKCGLVVERALTECGMKLAVVPSHVCDAFKRIGMCVTEVSPKLTRDKLRKCAASYVDIDLVGKHVLLKYCLKDGCYTELTDLQLLPLSNDTFDAYKKVRHPTTIYVCTQECPKFLLPNLEHRLVDITYDPELHSLMKKVANANCTQLKVLTPSVVASLISESMPKEWQGLEFLSFPNSFKFPSDWFKLFWEWIQKQQLDMFANNFILPVQLRDQQCPGHFRVVKLTTKPVLCGSSHNNALLSILDKFKVFCCVQEQFSFVVHKQLKNFACSYDAVGVVDAIHHSPKYDITLAVHEAEILRNLLGASAYKIKHYDHLVRNLKIFKAWSNASGQVYSIRDVSSRSILKTPLAVSSSSGTFDISILPPDIIVLSADDYHQKQLLQMLEVLFLSPVKLLTSYVFPHITKGSIPDIYVDVIMMEVIEKFDLLKFEDFTLTSVVGNLSFVKTPSGNRSCPAKLFDPDREDMSKIFAGKNVFPSQLYTQSECMTVLRACGLRTSISAQEVLDILQSTFQSSETTQCVDEETFSRAKAILQYIGRRDFYDQNCKTRCALFGQSATFSDAVIDFSCNFCWLPLASERPINYPKQLPWKGEQFASHLSTLNSSVSMSSASKASHSILYGSQKCFTVPVTECDVLTFKEELPAHLVAHLQVVISHVNSFTPADMMEVLHKLYSALLDVFRQGSASTLASLKSMKWLYIRSCHAFVSPRSVALDLNPGFRHNLEPYLHKLPDSLSDYSELFTACGVNSMFSEEQILSTMAAIKKDISNASMPISVDDCWKIVMAILNWLTESGNKVYSGSLKGIYVPAESNSEWPDLQPASEVTYTDNEFLKNFTLSSESEKPLVFVHSRISIRVAECLQLTPLSEELDIAGDTFEDTGQYEPLTTRLKNILRDYKDGLTIIKELIQNADDAEATEVNLLYDARTHSKERGKLFFPGMAESHGPALIIHNNKVFSDEDFENITKLAGATKQSKHLKIGKFGIGFCSVYHITDIPSFISRDKLYIFDPTLQHLGTEIKNPALPGKRLKFISRLIQNSNQLEPYQSLFGFSGRESYEGTMFRLPFRTAPSELSGKCYSETTALELLDDIYKCSETLILFLQHVRTITYQRIDEKEAQPITLFTVQRKEFSFTPRLNLNNTSALSIDSVRGSFSKSSKWLVSTYCTAYSGKDAVANVACMLETEDSAGRHSVCNSLNGEIFCYLPLAQSTGLPVHISCNFAVINNRRGIWTEDESTSASEAEVEWNDFLMKNVIPRAYSTLLYCLKSMQQSSILESYKFYGLWPLASELKQQNPWSKFVQKLYIELSKSTLFFSESRGEWRSIKDSNFLEPNILSRTDTPACVLEVLHHCNLPLVDLPIKYRIHLVLGDSVITELSFIELFFSNLFCLEAIYTSRNAVVKHMLELYASECDSYTKTSTVLKEKLTTRACIPCSPEGLKMKLVTGLIHPSAPFVKLYDPDEAMFPLKDIVNKNLPDLAVRKLGIVLEKIPWSYVIERAQTIKELVNSNQTKAYSRIKFVIEAIMSHTVGKPPAESDIASIEFLPVLMKPADFPLSWPGEGMILSCGKQMMCTGPMPRMPNVSLAGSQAVFLCEAEPPAKGCSHINPRAMEILGLSVKPLFSTVLAHLTLVIDNVEVLSPKWVDNACEQIYEFLDAALKLKQFPEGDCKCFDQLACIWTGSKFLQADQVSFMWSMDGPFLYQIPSMLRNKTSLCTKLRIKEFFSVDDIQKALLKMQTKFESVPINKRCQAIFKQLIPLLHDAEFEDSGFLLPDEKFILHSANNLAFNDAPWAPREDSYTYVHETIPRELARKIGVKPVRSKFLDKYSIHDFKGREFGQHETLTRRIQNILHDYPLDETLIKELLQNADDAKATKMHVILDERFHGTRSVFSEEWQDLQGPALLVWNDSVFSEKDLEGIQDLGLGSKRSEAETIGQFGIGFNVVYHITDCPSFVTNDETLCILDPHYRYVPGADALRPGRRFDNLNKGFWGDFPDVKSTYLRHKLANLPKEMLGGSLFRFPIRHEKRKIAESQITEDPKSVLSVHQLYLDLHKWMKKMKEAMLFLNNVSELKFLIIEEESNQLRTIFHYQSRIEEASLADRNLLQSALSSFKPHKEHKPGVITYPLILTEVNSGGQEDKWLIQQGVGDIFNSSQMWEYLNMIKPRHGIASPLSTKTKDFKGQAFCFLPLPVKSGLPVHVNGHFILNSTRRNLWSCTDISEMDGYSKWNNSIMQAISSSYAEFLIRARTHYVAEEYKSIRTALSCIEHYYSLFPNISSKSENLWNTLACRTYEVILQRNLPIFCVLKSAPNGYTTQWFPPKSASPSDHIYYWEPSHYYSDKHKEVFPILENIGMKVTPIASSYIMGCFNDILKKGKSPILFSSITRHSIFEYYTKFSVFSAHKLLSPTAVEDTVFQDVGSYVLFTKYLLEETPTMFYSAQDKVCTYPNYPFSHYLLLTADGVLRRFKENAKVLMSSFSQLFPNSLHCFLHPELLDVHYTSSYFIQPYDNDCARVASVILQLMDNDFPRALKLAPMVADATAIISEGQLTSLWKCFSEDKVFNKHIPDVLKNWALLLTTDNRLYSASSIILPINYVTSEEKVIVNVTKVVRKLDMPFLSTKIVTAEANCPRITDAKRILSNLYHVNREKPILPLLDKSDLNDIIYYLQHYLEKVLHTSELVKHLQSLPLFENIDGSYTSIWGKDAYIWPTEACFVAYQKWLKGHNAIFIKGNAKWSLLNLTVKTIYTENLYTTFIFKHFHQMNSAERYQHLKYIKDVLFQTYKSNSQLIIAHFKNIAISERKNRAISFIDALKILPCIGSNDSALRPVSAYCDHTVSIFNAFASHFLFLPEEYKDKNGETSWLNFFRDIGLKQTVTRKEFIQFSQETQDCRVHDISWCSNVLLYHLLVIETTWHNDKDFLSRVSDITFVQQEHIPQFTWLVPSAYPVNQMVCLRGSVPLCLGSLLWTVKPVVKLPVDVHTESSMMKLLGIIVNPRKEEVLQNITNICKKSPYTQQSLFSIYPDSLVCTSEHSLLQILEENYLHFSAEGAQISPKDLQLLPCIPVYHTTFKKIQSNRKMVLVKPSCVIQAQSKVRKFHPFLHCLPMQFQLNTFLQSLGVKDELEIGHIQIALQSAFEASEGSTLDKNTEQCVITAIDKLYDFLQENENKKRHFSPLYLPDSDNVLRPSKSLLYGDIVSYLGDFPLQLNDVPYYHFNISLADYKHTALDICRLLPVSVRPVGLSVACRQEVLESQETEHSKLAVQFMKTIGNIAEIPEGIILFVNTLVKKQKNEEKLIEIVRTYLDNIELITIKDLKSKIILKDYGKCIGVKKMRFCYLPSEIKSLLYLDSSLLDGDDVYTEVADHLCGILCQYIKEELEPSQQNKISHLIKKCLRARNGDMFKSELLSFGIRLNSMGIERFSRRIGEEIPQCWHHRIDQDIDYVFNPMEYVGYEDREGHVIVAQIVHPIKLKDGESKLEMKYKIFIKEDDEEGRDVSILLLYKFLIGKKKPKLEPVPDESDKFAVQPFDASDNIVNYRASLIVEDLTELKRNICSQLRDIWKLSPDLRRRAIKRLFLRWHPDKNLEDEQRASKVFQYLLKQLEHLEKGEPLDDPAARYPEPRSYHKSHCHYWHSYSSYNHDFYQWNRTASRHSAYSENEREYFSQGSRSHHASSYFFPFEEVKDERNPEEGERWVKQAEIEFKVLSLVHSQADVCFGYSYICFMAHQVVEKALKGGVYALCGMDGRSLMDHNLSRHAYALEAKKPESCGGLVMHSTPLENYYLNTRYPNRWNGYTDAPAEHYSQEQADEAKEHAKAVLANVRAIMPALK